MNIIYTADTARTSTLTQTTIDLSTEFRHSRQIKTVFDSSGRVSNKDGLCFMFGTIKDNDRKHIIDRTAVVLDFDGVDSQVIDAIKTTGIRGVVFSTASHLISKAKGYKHCYRWVVPLAQTITSPIAYAAAYAELAELVGYAADEAAARWSQLMYYPTHDRSITPVYHYFDGEVYDYKGKQDEWADRRPPYHKTHTTEISGIQGEFNKYFEDKSEYLLQQWYEKFTQNGDDIRACHISSTSGISGLVRYADGYWYSHHSIDTDPNAGKSLDIFNLYRLCEFGHLDNDYKGDKDSNKAPSYKAMIKFAQDELPIRKGFYYDSKMMLRVSPGDLAIVVADTIEYLGGYMYNPQIGIWVEDINDSSLRLYIQEQIPPYLCKTAVVNDILTQVKTILAQTTLPSQDKYKYVLQNGVYNVLDNSFSTIFDREIYARHCHPIEYDPTALCPAFDLLVDLLIDTDAQASFNEMMGYIYYPDYNINALFLLIGKQGGEGKSELIKMITAPHIFDPQAYVTASFSQIVGDNFTVKRLVNKLVCVMHELDKGDERTIEPIKTLTGNDIITPRIMHSQAVKASKNIAKIIALGNSYPHWYEESDALQRRLVVFTVKTERKEHEEVYNDLCHYDIIKQESAGIFNKSMQGLRRLLKQNAFTLSTQQQKEAKDIAQIYQSVKLFLQEFDVSTLVNPTLQQLHHAYLMHFEGTEIRIIQNEQSFGEKLKREGWTHTRKRLKKGSDERTTVWQKI